MTTEIAKRYLDLSHRTDAVEGDEMAAPRLVEVGVIIVFDRNRHSPRPGATRFPFTRSSTTASSCDQAGSIRGQWSSPDVTAGDKPHHWRQRERELN